jgi:predicted AAA+ superfamily ATPase
MTRVSDISPLHGDHSAAKALERIAAALEWLAGAPGGPCDFNAADAFVFAARTATLVPIAPQPCRYQAIAGINQARDILLANTERFTQGFAAINVRFFGARGMGKSALIKAARATINTQLAG